MTNNPNLEKSFNMISSANRLSSFIIDQLRFGAEDGDKDAITKSAIQLTYMTLQFLNSEYSKPEEVAKILEEAQSLLDTIVETKGSC